MKKLLVFTISLSVLAQNINYLYFNNDISTGTILYHAAVINASGNAINSSSTADVIEGIVVGGAGLSGKATLCVTGNCACVFDNTPVTSDYVTLGSSGQCHSAGSSVPSTGQIIGKVSPFLPVPSGASANVDLTLRQTIVTSSGSGTVNYGVNSVACSTSPNFNLNTALYSVQAITLTCNVTSMSFSNLIAGAIVTFRVCRDGVNRAFPAWPGVVHGGFVNNTPIASKCDSQTFYSPDGTNLWSNGLGVLNQ